MGKAILSVAGAENPLGARDLQQQSQSDRQMSFLALVMELRWPNPEGAYGTIE